jgi:MFS family permease
VRIERASHERDAAQRVRTSWLLVSARGARSIWQGALVVDFALYLHALGWSAVSISAVLAGALVLGAVLTMLLGPLSDRFGRRKFLLAYDAAQGVAAAVAFITTAPAPLAAAAIVGGFGRGGSGAAGPFSPVEQAWLAQCVPASRRGPFYSLNAAVGFLGMAVGAVLAGLPQWTAAATPSADAYRPLFAATTLLSVICFALVAAGKDARSDLAPRRGQPDRSSERQRENRLIRRLVIANSLNGIGLGLTGPLMSYWFALRFHQGAGAIGPMMAISFVLAAGSSLFSRWLMRWMSIVRTVVAMRAVGLLLLLALPFAPSFALASVLYIGRTVLNRGTSGPRSAVNVGIVRPARRGFSAASANVALQIPRAIGPVVAGLCYEVGLFAEPFLAAAVFQAAYVWIYDRSFRDVTLR